MHFLHYCQIPGNDCCSRLITQTVVKILLKKYINVVFVTFLRDSRDVFVLSDETCVGLARPNITLLGVLPLRGQQIFPSPALLALLLHTHSPTSGKKKHTQKGTR